MEKYDVFISYAHLDNETGWVSEFDEVFKKFLNAWLGRPAQIWRDRSMGTGDYIWETIEENLLKSMVFISIISPSYVNSNWCSRELITFLTRKKHQLGEKSYVFNVRRLPVEKQQIPTDLRDVLEKVLYLEFFKKEESGKIRIFAPDRGEDLRRYFIDNLEDLAQDVYQSLQSLQANSSENDESVEETNKLQPFLGKSIYLSEPSPDLLGEFLEIKRDFLNRGATILPASIVQAKPQTIAEYEKQVVDEMKRSELVVHFVGSTDDEFSESDPRSLVRQLTEISQKCQSEADFTRLILIPKDVQPNTERRRQLINQLLETTTGKVDLLRTTLDLKIEMERFLEKKQIPVENDQSQTVDKSEQNEQSNSQKIKLTVYVLYEREDEESVTDFSAKLFEQGCEVWTVSKNDQTAQADLLEEHKWYLANCDAALVYWDKAKMFRVRALMSEFVSILDNGREKNFAGKGIYINGSSPEKDNFMTHETVIRNDTELADFIAELKPVG